MRSTSDVGELKLPAACRAGVPLGHCVIIIALQEKRRRLDEVPCDSGELQRF